MCGKALPVGTDWGVFLWKNPPLFNNFHRVFNRFREENKKEAWKSAFLPENCVENLGKTVEYPFFCRKTCGKPPVFHPLHRKIRSVAYEQETKKDP
ncbi:MAG: hypothetical protein MR557_07850 [Faecalibacterium sp.]|nr:hypothetical protein [Faecalibacterium sp.]